MTNKTDEQILADCKVCTGWTHHVIDNGTNYTFLIDKMGTAIWIGKWDCYTNSKDSLPDLYGIRSRSDIEELVKLRKENAELESQLMEYASYLNMSLDGTEAHSDVDKRFLNHQAIRDLEQQIKAYARAEYMCPGSIRKKANELRKQAKGGDLVEKDQ